MEFVENIMKFAFEVEEKIKVDAVIVLEVLIVVAIILELIMEEL